ncbi:MAG: cytochrome c biogenesis protein CcdA [Treponema sp.]|jgi:cytochrome c-type biogenesis protein|nr:cytochrome c biogenesis protein CcdA [Treponema sp.]
MDLSLPLAFGAGLLSFLSPCVLPLIPSYLSMLCGMSPRDPRARPKLVAGTLSFILGFSAVFIVLSILFSAAFSLTGGISRYITAAAGIIVIILGLNTVFDFLSFLKYEKRFHGAPRPVGITGAFFAGTAFAAGWTPCVGPILTGILLMAGQQGKAGVAALYLACYSAGLALPFLGAAFFFERFLAGAAGLRARLPLLRRISGLVLVFIGVLILTGRFTALNILILKIQYRFIDWAEDQALPFRLLARWFNRLLEI